MPDKSISQGSGVVIRNNIIATNKHVIDGASDIVISQGSRFWHVQEIAISSIIDVAFVKVVDLDLMPIPQRQNAKLDTGSKIFTLGNPKGLEFSFSDGIISGSRDFDGVNYFQLTAPISPGSSGGALLDQSGKLLGITTFKFRGGENLNFAISIENVSKELENITYIPVSKLAKDAHDSALEDTFKKSTLAIKNNDFDTAITLLLPIYQENPENSKIRINLSLAFSQKGFNSFDTAFIDDALACSKKAIDLDKNNRFAWHLMGRIYYRQNRYTDAITPFKRAISIDSKDKYSIYYLGFCYVALQQKDDARKCFRDLMGIDNTLANDLWDKGVFPLIRP